MPRDLIKIPFYCHELTRCLPLNTVDAIAANPSVSVTESKTKKPSCQWNWRFGMEPLIRKNRRFFYQKGWDRQQELLCPPSDNLFSNCDGMTILVDNIGFFLLILL